MLTKNQNSIISYWLYSFLILGGVYFFGTFGILNLLGIRNHTQVIYVIVVYIVSLLLMRQNKYNISYTNIVLTIILFISLYLNIIRGDNDFLKIIEYVLMAFLIITIMNVSKKYFIKVTKTLVVITVILCVFVLIAFVYYQINPREYSSANFDIYDSTVGGGEIYPNHIMDWLTFTSGDGYVAFGYVINRMKGYSNEPSSTMVHYLTPAIFGLFLGGWYSFCAVIIIFVNVLSIASFTTYIIVTLSLIIFIIIKIFKKMSGYMLSASMLFMLIAITQANFMFEIFEKVGNFTLDSNDLILRKIGGGIDKSTLGSRQLGIYTGINNLISEPFGYSSNKLGPGAGLMYIVSSISGWVGSLIFIYFNFKLYNKLLRFNELKKIRTLEKYGVALSLATLFVALFISGYGWDRLPGIVMLTILFRIISEAIENESN
jgi:hypothetical protein